MIVTYNSRYENIEDRAIDRWWFWGDVLRCHETTTWVEAHKITPPSLTNREVRYVNRPSHT